MKRNKDLDKAILKDIEGVEPGDTCRGVTLDEYSQPEIDFHIEHLINEGLIDGSIFKKASGTTFGIKGLTPAGDLYLNS